MRSVSGQTARTCGAYGEEAFYGGGFNTTPFSGRLAVTKEDDTYRIGYCDKRSLGFFYGADASAPR